MRTRNCLDVIDGEYWPDEPDLTPSAAPWSSADSDPKADLRNYRQFFSQELSNYFVDPVMAEQINAMAQAMAHYRPQVHVWHAHTKGHSSEESLAALESIAKGETADEWKEFRNRLRPNQDYPRENVTHARNNKHRGKGKRKK